MLTSSHIAIGYLVFRKKDKIIRMHAVLGAIVPDAAMLCISLIMILNNPSEFWNAFHAHQDISLSFIDDILGNLFNSLFLWISIVGIGYYKNKPLFTFGVSGLLHVTADLLTHQGAWTWNHFYPFFTWEIQGIVDASKPEFFIPIHIIWICIFGYFMLQKQQARKSKAKS